MANSLWLAAMGMRQRPECTKLGESCPHQEPDGRCGRTKESCGVPAAGSVGGNIQKPIANAQGTLGHPIIPELEIVGLRAEDLPHLRRYRDFLDGQIQALENFLEVQSPACDAKYRSKTIFYHSIGNLHYLTGMEHVWLGRRYFDLRAHKRARLCLLCMAEANAVDENSALHFLKEIDPYVREKGNFEPLGKFSVTKIQDCFRDPSGEVAILCQRCIKRVGSNGKYYLDPVAE